MPATCQIHVGSELDAGEAETLDVSQLLRAISILKRHDPEADEAPGAAAHYADDHDVGVAAEVSASAAVNQ